MKLKNSKAFQSGIYILIFYSALSYAKLEDVEVSSIGTGKSCRSILLPEKILLPIHCFNEFSKDAKIGIAVTLHHSDGKEEPINAKNLLVNPNDNYVTPTKSSRGEYADFAFIKLDHKAFPSALNILRSLPKLSESEPITVTIKGGSAHECHIEGICGSKIHYKCNSIRNSGVSKCFMNGDSGGVIKNSKNQVIGYHTEGNDYGDFCYGSGVTLKAILGRSSHVSSANTNNDAPDNYKKFKGYFADLANNTEWSLNATELAGHCNKSYRIFDMPNIANLPLSDYRYSGTIENFGEGKITSFDDNRFVAASRVSGKFCVITGKNGKMEKCIENELIKRTNKIVYENTGLFRLIGNHEKKAENGYLLNINTNNYDDIKVSANRLEKFPSPYTISSIDNYQVIGSKLGICKFTKNNCDIITNVKKKDIRKSLKLNDNTILLLGMDDDANQISHCSTLTVSNNELINKKCEIENGDQLNGGRVLAASFVTPNLVIAGTDRGVFYAININAGAAKIQKIDVIARSEITTNLDSLHDSIRDIKSLEENKFIAITSDGNLMAFESIQNNARVSLQLLNWMYDLGLYAESIAAGKDWFAVQISGGNILIFKKDS